jgi:hypothetical protein
MDVANGERGYHVALSAGGTQEGYRQLRAMQHRIRQNQELYSVAKEFNFFVWINGLYEVCLLGEAVRTPEPIRKPLRGENKERLF